MTQNVKNAITSLADTLKRKAVPFSFGRHCFLASDYMWAKTLIG
jgi:hypothetical protein